MASSEGSRKRRKITGKNSNAVTDKPPEGESSYAKSYQRISKDNLYMIIALWMEDFVDEAPEHHRKVGAVLVLPNDVVLAADCSRDGVHAVARLLIKHHNKAEGCKMFISRKPCPFCAKLLVQSKVNRVIYLPFEPEYYRDEINNQLQIDESNNTQMKQVDNLFAASAIAQTKFILQVENAVLDHAKLKERDQEVKVENYKKVLIDKYSAFKEDSKWINSIKEKLPWPEFDKKIEKQVREYFKEVVEWIARVLVRSGHHELKPPPQNTDDVDWFAFDPVNNLTHKKQVHHFTEIARFLAERTDDPKTGVGAVIVSRKMEIVAFGWNGFPLKAAYGEFARGSKHDPSADKKYPYRNIHAEQNALLMRNNKNIEGAILFVTKSPCNECAPLIAMQGIKTVVVDDVIPRNRTTQTNALDYEKFPELVKKGKFICYESHKAKFYADRFKKFE